MEPKIYFVEYELKTNELFAEFYLKQEDGRDVIATILVDNETSNVKEVKLFVSYYDEDGNHTGTSDIEEGEFNVDDLSPVLLKALKEKQEGSGYDRNYFYHC